MTPQDLSQWEGRARPVPRTLEGRFARLEPLDAGRHLAGLFAASSVLDCEERFRWLPDHPPRSEADLADWIAQIASGADPMFFAVIDRASGRVAGRQALMRIDAANGVAEIGNVYWGPLISQRPAATEALYLFMAHVFDDLGYRRFEWKCNDDNAPSKRAALRFGFSFEGVFRQHLVVKGRNRDTAWYSVIDSEWPLLKRSFEAWLSEDNFDETGTQRRKLSDFITAASAAS